MDITVPGLKQPIGLGDVVKRATEAVGITPCGGCLERARKLNEMLTFAPSIQVPEGLRAQGQRDITTQIWLVETPDGWSTFEYVDAPAAEHKFTTEAEARADFLERMKA